MTLHFSEWQQRLIFGLWLALVVIISMGYLVNPEFQSGINEIMLMAGDRCGWMPDGKCPPGWL